MFSSKGEPTSMHTKSDRGSIKESSKRPWKILFDKKILMDKNNIIDKINS